MTEDSNLGHLKVAYQAWHDSKGGSPDVWLDLFSDDIVLHSMSEDAAGLEFCRDRNCKQEVVNYFSSLLDDWSMVHFSPDTYVCQGDRIAVFGSTAWTNKATGKNAEVSVAHLWTFRDGKAVEMREVFDSARAAAAAA